ncbi:taurine catabolism dioxygenase TauD [Thiohalocapsa halophila]|uniref:Taurine catabolism dioxygenase TauD n=1 Tax=Thiohalocapsa halophila TaxID=69359 RepID=A0ABS1CL22_9GAMM|nr:TauD/TfdA family dioxygenase [Thiohalocapsa halophila]MBK1632534.1 taurine catabolism dioxygenase TauD [Thiohalocapsa halophila]
MPRHVTPLSLSNHDAYRRWRDAKLADLPESPADLVVEVDDPRRLTDAEAEAIRECCRRWNMAVYRSRVGDDPDKAIPRLLGARFGLQRLDHNPGADEDAITAVTIQSDALHRGFIPYTDKPIAWHTDGYYNSPQRQIRAFILHCVRPAAEGGENALLDPEIVYIRLRDRDPAHIRALMHSEAMTIPPNVVDGEELRPASTGPVFMSGEGGSLAMRYTDRKRNIHWRDDAATTAAVAALREVLAAEDTPVLRLRLESGWGVICNNALHTRTRFSDAGEPRMLYRGRYYERIQGT